MSYYVQDPAHFGQVGGGMQPGGLFIPPVMGMIHPPPRLVQYNGWVISGTHAPWDDNALSTGTPNGQYTTYFPASTNLQAIQTVVRTYLVATLQPSNVGGNADIAHSHYRIYVSYQAVDGANPANEAFYVSQMYPH